MEKRVSGLVVTRLAVSGLVVALLMMMAGCNRPSRAEQYRAEKHAKDSVRLEEQVRSLAYYQTQLDSLMPQADSLIALFKYERNEKYQDHGMYVVKNERLKMKDERLRVMVRDDGEELLIYKDGKRLTNERVNELTNAREALERAQHLQIVIHDIKELEQRIRKTTLEIQKYEKRLTNERLNE